jgi:hypothetical protein
MRTYFVCIFFLCFAFTVHAQAPSSQVYLFKLEQITGLGYVAHSPRYLSQFNPKGYTNQPHFKDDKTLLLTAQMQGQNQTDIYALDLKQQTIQRVTATSLSEYSPTLTPDKKFISCVRVDEPGTALQRLYKYEWKASGGLISPIPDFKNVGYHTWLDDKTLALFLVNKPNQIAIVNIDTKDPLIFSTDIGRCLLRNEKGNLLYVHKLSDAYWYIKEYDLIQQKATIITETVPGAEDFALTDQGHLIMGKDSKLFVFRPGADKAWTLIADLSHFGIQNIKRLAIHGSELALVEQSK